MSLCHRGQCGHCYRGQCVTVTEGHVSLFYRGQCHFYRALCVTVTGPVCQSVTGSSNGVTLYKGQ